MRLHAARKSINRRNSFNALREIQPLLAAPSERQKSVPSCSGGGVSCEAMSELIVGFCGFVRRPSCSSVAPAGPSLETYRDPYEARSRLPSPEAAESRRTFGEERVVLLTITET